MRHTDNSISGFFNALRVTLPFSEINSISASSPSNDALLRGEKPPGYDEHYSEVESRYGKLEKTTYWPVVDASKCQL